MNARLRASMTTGRQGVRRFIALVLLVPTLAVLGGQVSPAAATEPAVCSGTHLNPPAQGDKTSFTYTAPDGYLIVSWCVKSSTTPEYHDASDGHGHVLPAKSVTITHSSGKEVSHYSVTLVKTPEKPLDASVTATGTLHRTYPWSIQKVADATRRTVDATGKATFTYTVTARGGAATDSGWMTSGNVTVDNDNTYPITADVTVATNLGGGSSCTVTGGNDVVVPAADDVTLAYTCSFTSAPAASGTVTATVTWDPDGADTTASDTATAPVSFTVASETNKTVAVVDNKTVPGQRIVLDPALTWSPGLVKTYTYSLAVAGGAAGACASHTNIATIDVPVGTDPTATATVQACTPPAVVQPDVLPEQAFGKAVGSVSATCQGTVRSRLNNRSGERVTYKLRVGTKVHRIVVKAQSKKRFTTSGPNRARVTLKIGSRVLDRVRIPARCAAPEVLPDTGLRGI